MVFLIWAAVGLLVGHALARHWYQVHQRWLLAVAEREAGRSLGGRRGPRRIYWEFVGSFRRGFGYRFVRADPEPDIELLRQKSLAAWRSTRLRFYLFAVAWLGGGFALLTVLR